MNSFRFLEGLIRFNNSHLCHAMNRYELTMFKVLCKDFLQNSSVQELQIDAEIHEKTVSFNGQRFKVGYMVDDTYHAMPRHLDEEILEVFYTRHKRMHALKLSVVCAVQRKWIYEVAFFAGQSSDLTSWEQQPFRKLFHLRHGV